LEPGLEKAREEIGALAQSEEDVLSYALFPQVARPFLTLRREGVDRREAMVAAVAARLLKDRERTTVSAPAGGGHNGWKTAVGAARGGGGWGIAGI
jgi:pyruvate/oxaloacetate carboxyltransferase